MLGFIPFHDVGGDVFFCEVPGTLTYHLEGFIEFGMVHGHVFFPEDFAQIVQKVSAKVGISVLMSFFMELEQRSDDFEKAGGVFAEEEFGLQGRAVDKGPSGVEGVVIDLDFHFIGPVVSEQEGPVFFEGRRAGRGCVAEAVGQEVWYEQGVQQRDVQGLSGAVSPEGVLSGGLDEVAGGVEQGEVSEGLGGEGQEFFVDKGIEGEEAGLARGFTDEINLLLSIRLQVGLCEGVVFCGWPDGKAVYGVVALVEAEVSGLFFGKGAGF